MVGSASFLTWFSAKGEHREYTAKKSPPWRRARRLHVKVGGELSPLEDRLEKGEGARVSGLADKKYKPVYGIFLWQQGRRDDAIREFEKLAKSDPNDRAAR